MVWWLRLLHTQATHLANEPTQVALSRQAAGDLHQMQREEAALEEYA